MSGARRLDFVSHNALARVHVLPLTLALALAVGLALPPKATAADGKMRILIEAGLSYSMPSVNSSGTTFGRGTGFSGGASFTFPLSSTIGAEVGLLSLRRTYTESLNGTESVFSSQWITVPLLFRFQLVPRFSIALGGYGSYWIGGASKKTGEAAIDVTPAQLALRRTDFGATASASYTIPVGGDWGLAFDARYFYGVSNIASSGSFYFTDIAGFVGFVLQRR